MFMMRVQILKCGKKLLAQNIVKTAFQIIETRTNENPMLIFEKAIRNASPIVELKSRRIGGSTYQVPVEVRPERQMTMAMRWIIDASRKRKEKSMAYRVAAELMEAVEGRGAAVKKREDTHKMAEANKAFAHFRW